MIVTLFSGVSMYEGLGCGIMQDTALGLHVRSFYVISSLLSLKSRLMRWPCLCLYVYLPVTTFACQNQSLWNLIFISWHLSSSQWHHNSLLSVIPTSKRLKFLRQNLNTDWMPVPVFTKLDMYMSCCLRPYHWHTWWIPLISNISTIASQIVEVVPLILVECLNWLSWDHSTYILTCRMVRVTKWRVLVRLIGFVSTSVTHTHS
jgi:hypothetical protein